MQGSHHLDERFSARERVQNRREVCLETAKQVCSARVPDPHPDDGGSALKHLANDEVLILGDDDRAHVHRVGTNAVIGSRRQAAISHVLCNVTERFDSSCERRWQLCVDQEAAIRRSAAPDDRFDERRTRGPP